MGNTWPAAVPSGKEATVNPPPGSDNYNADSYGNAVAAQTIRALTTPTYVTDGTVGGADGSVSVESTNPLLLADVAAPAVGPSPHIERAYLPPWGAGDVFVTRATALRVGDLAFFSGPGEPYASILFSLNHAVKGAAVKLILGLGQDQ